MSSLQPDSYLKSLSKKQYSWMQQASSPQGDAVVSPELDRPVDAPSADHVAAAAPAAESVNIPKQPLKQTMQHEKAPEKVPSTAKPKVTSQDRNDNEQNEENRFAKQHEAKNKPTSKPKFKYTTFPVKGFNILPTRNITSQYARNDSLNLQGILAGSEDIKPDVSLICHSSMHEHSHRRTDYFQLLRRKQKDQMSL
jgi:hypothetical protein